MRVRLTAFLLVSSTACMAADVMVGGFPRKVLESNCDTRDTLAQRGMAPTDLPEAFRAEAVQSVANCDGIADIGANPSPLAMRVALAGITPTAPAVRWTSNQLDRACESLEACGSAADLLAAAVNGTSISAKLQDSACLVRVQRPERRVWGRIRCAG